VLNVLWKFIFVDEPKVNALCGGTSLRLSISPAIAEIAYLNYSLFMVMQVFTH